MSPNDPLTMPPSLPKDKSDAIRPAQPVQYRRLLPGRPCAGGTRRAHRAAHAQRDGHLRGTPGPRQPVRQRPGGGRRAPGGARPGRSARRAGLRRRTLRHDQDGRRRRHGELLSGRATDPRHVRLHARGRGGRPRRSCRRLPACCPGRKPRPAAADPRNPRRRRPN